MEPDDEICLCFHVTLRKIRNYLRSHSIRHASQLSECHGAGTGCGWCRPFLERQFQQTRGAEPKADEQDLPASSDYARLRAVYRQQRGDAETPTEKPL